MTKHTVKLIEGLSTFLPPAPLADRRDLGRIVTRLEVADRTINEMFDDHDAHEVADIIHRRHAEMLARIAREEGVTLDEIEYAINARTTPRWSYFNLGVGGAR